MKFDSPIYIGRKIMTSEIKKLSPEMIEALQEDFPPEAYSSIPGKEYLTTLKAYYVTERLNQVFGVGRWVVIHKIQERSDSFVLVKGRIKLLDYPDLQFSVSYGGHNTTGKNTDAADGFKSAVTDLTSKQASFLGIGHDMFKGNIKAPNGNKNRKPDNQDRGSGAAIDREDYPAFGKYAKGKPDACQWMNIPDHYLEYCRNNSKDKNVQLFVNKEIEFRIAQGSAEDPDAGSPGMKSDAFHKELLTVQGKFKEQKDGIAIFSEYLMKKFSTTDLKKIAKDEVVFSTRVLDDMREFFKDQFPDWNKNGS